MFHINRLKIVELFQQKINFSLDDINLITNEIELYKYPIGVIPIGVIEGNPLYGNATLINNLNYFKQIIPNIFNNIYLPDELDIINVFLTIISYTKKILLEDTKELILSYINKSSEKAEIQYCIDELKYIYLQHLIYIQSSDEMLINKLINELSRIEKDHNAIDISQLKELPT